MASLVDKIQKIPTKTRALGFGAFIGILVIAYIFQFQIFLFHPAGLRIGAGQQRRRKMKLQRVVAFKTLVDLLQKIGLGIQPRYLVFVLDRHQLEQVVRHGFRELR